jgi:UDP-N-acetylmuramoyl-L-alanyl-D-glutamate--2,6-diaminopimelate ligase
VDAGVPVVTVPSTLAALASLSARFYGRPSEKLKVVGVTGTNGKTTTTYMIERVLRAARLSAGVIGTVEYRWGGKTEQAPNTTPFSSDLQALLARMRKDRVTHVAMEVSSHALELHRVDDVAFEAAVFTNLTRDHLDFHGTMENYFEAKAKLFDKLAEGQKGGKRRFAIINSDDPWSEKLLARLKTDRLTYGVRKPADLFARDIELAAEGTSFLLAAQGKDHPVRLQTVGLHNVYNALAAAGACLALGLPAAAVRKGLAALPGVPGRLERVSRPGKEAPSDKPGRRSSGDAPFSVFVDYAHTDDALRNVLQALRPLTRGRLIVVFGCGGDRDRTKRPLMGEAAATLADRVIITSDNPRTEDPAKITLDIEVGARRVTTDRYEIVLQREQAIEKAVRAARKGDVVLIAGKGHETYQIFKDRTIDFDDRVVAREALRRL